MAFGRMSALSPITGHRATLKNNDTSSHDLPRCVSLPKISLIYLQTMLGFRAGGLFPVEDSSWDGPGKQVSWEFRRAISPPLGKLIYVVCSLSEDNSFRAIFSY